MGKKKHEGIVEVENYGDLFVTEHPNFYGIVLLSPAGFTIRASSPVELDVRESRKLRKALKRAEKLAEGIL